MTKKIKFVTRGVMTDKLVSKMLDPEGEGVKRAAKGMSKKDQMVNDYFLSTSPELYSKKE